MAKTLIKGGIVHDGKGKQFTTLRDALAHDTKCGCGLDCNNGYLVLPNYNPSSGDVDEYMAVYIVDGSIKVDTIANAKAEIHAYCIDPDISATSSRITGCLSGTDLIIGATRQLTGEVLPVGSVQTGTWESDDEAVATVSGSGLVTGVAAGTATITFTSTDGGFEATCVVTVIVTPTPTPTQTSTPTPTPTTTPTPTPTPA